MCIVSSLFFNLRCGVRISPSHGSCRTFLPENSQNYLMDNNQSHLNFSRVIFLLFMIFSLPFSGLSQSADDHAVQDDGAKPLQPGQTTPNDPNGVPARPAVDKRILGVLPNYRTAEMFQATHPLTAKQKLRISLKDSFDYPLVGLSAAYAGLYQLENSHPEFGQGVKGYASRLGTSYADQVQGNMFTEGFLPVLFREDPRYFRMAEGSKEKRTIYALTRIFVTRTDAGGKSFNFAEVIGNGMASGIGLSYYPDSRNAPDYFQNFGIQLATDATSQVLKEFWPDIKHWWKTRRNR